MLENEVRKLGELLVIDYQGDVINYQASERNWNTVEASGNRLPACVIDYTEEWVTGNRLPGMCNRLHSALLHISCPEAV